jgi:hypothetical protein
VAIRIVVCISTSRDISFWIIVFIVAIIVTVRVLSSMFLGHLQEIGVIGVPLVTEVMTWVSQVMI